MSIRAAIEEVLCEHPHEAPDVVPRQKFSQHGRCADGAGSTRATHLLLVVATNLRTTIMSRRTMTRCRRASTIKLGDFQSASG